MNTRLTTLLVACLGMVGSYGYSLDSPAIHTPSTEIHRTDLPTHNETLNQYKTMDRGMFQDQTFNKMEIKNNLDEARIAQFRLALRNDPTLVPFIEAVHFTQNGDTLVIFGTVDSEATKARIESNVKAIPGVNKVENNLIVK